jgi:hypothetical protein
MNTVYFGETTCVVSKRDGTPCGSKAYFTKNATGECVCGKHAKKTERTQLPKNPDAAANKQAEIDVHRTTCDAAAANNLSVGKKGQVSCAKMRMMAAVELVPGFINIFPNFLHKNRKDGVGLPSLSPKAIGPVAHGQPGLPDSLNLENFHQGNKVFPSEVETDPDNGNRKPTAAFYELREKMYLDKEPHRHKQTATSAVTKTGRKNKNIPLFSVWIDKDGTEHQIDYFTSREFYCHFYERATVANPDYQLLVDKINSGHNLRIVGYDGYAVTKTLEEHYCDTSRPFGHEMVLYAMLTAKPDEWPWRKHKTFDY